MPALIFAALTVAVVLVSAVACLLAHQAMLKARLHAATCSTYASQLADALRKLKHNDVQVAELGELCEALTKSLHKVRSREGMRALRERDAPNSVDELKGEAWKAAKRKELRLAIATRVNSD